ncbi:MAG TPA: GntR family transcriptional regulator [Gaiellaceae bacterium]|jgi:DNA-binding GntR family transcriptional regulator
MAPAAHTLEHGTVQTEADRRALVDQLAAALQARILSGEIASGTRLRQEALADEFGVSRTPVREALRKLQATGLIELRPHRGALVRHPTTRELREAYEVRAELEGLAAELAATRIQDAQLDRLREAERLFRRSITGLLESRRSEPGSDPPDETLRDWEQANDLFHLAIQEASGNERLRLTLADLHRSFPRRLTWLALSGSSHLLEENVEQHAGILRAIERRDTDEARRLMSEHIRRAGELVVLRFDASA